MRKLVSLPEFPDLKRFILAGAKTQVLQGHTAWAVQRQPLPSRWPLTLGVLEVIKATQMRPTAITYNTAPRRKVAKEGGPQRDLCKNKHKPHKPIQAKKAKEANKQSNLSNLVKQSKQTNKQTNKQENKKAGRRAVRQAGRQASQTNNLPKCLFRLSVSFDPG